MRAAFKQMTDFLVGLGTESVPHTGKFYLAHLIAVYRFLQNNGCNEDTCLAGLFHSIYGTERFQSFPISLEKRPEIIALIGERAERLAYWNCFMDRASLDRALELRQPPYMICNRVSGAEEPFAEEDFNDLCRVHLYDWLEQVPRSQEWDYRRAAYRRMAERLGEPALTVYKQTFRLERAGTEVSHMPR